MSYILSILYKFESVEPIPFHAFALTHQILLFVLILQCILFKGAVITVFIVDDERKNLHKKMKNQPVNRRYIFQTP